MIVSYGLIVLLLVVLVWCISNMDDDEWKPRGYRRVGRWLLRLAVVAVTTLVVFIAFGVYLAIK